MRPHKDDVGTENVACQPIVGTESIACQPCGGAVDAQMPQELVRQIEVILGKRGSRMSSKVEEALKSAGVDCKVVVLPDSTRSAKEAASTIGCSVAEIAKSIVFRAAQSDRAVLVVASGVNQVDEKKLQAKLGEEIVRATPEFVREKTGFPIGGVSPVGHTGPVVIFIDSDLLTFSKVWAAAGTPFSVFCSTPQELIKLTGAEVIHVKKGS